MNRLILFTFMLGGLSPLWSQSTAKTRTLYLTFLGVEKDLDHLYLSETEGSKPHFIPSGQFHPPYEMQSDGLVRLYAKNSDGEMKPVANTAIPHTLKEVLILVFENPERSGTYSLVPVNFSMQNFPKGAFKILNLTSRPVGGRIRDQTVQVGVRKSTLLQLASQQRTLPVMLVYPGQTAKESLLSTTWFHNPRHRYLVFLYPDADQERVGIRTIRHFPRSPQQTQNQSRP